MAISRSNDGFSALPAGDPLADLDIGNPRKWATFMEDFLAYDVTQLVGGNPYTLTVENACVDTIVGPTGVLALTLGGTDNDSGMLRLTSVGVQTNAKRLYFEARLNLTLASGGTVAANEIFVGLSGAQTTTNFIAAGGTSLAADNCMGFIKYDAGATAFSVNRKVDVESTDATVWTPTDGTWVTLSFYFDGSSTYYYVDKALKSTLVAAVPTVVMAPTLYVKAGEAKANVLNVDYVLLALER